MKKRIWAALAVGLLALGACGGDDGESSSGEGGSSTTEAAASAEPVVIEHRFGTTTIDEVPKRIVSYDAQWTDVLAALDAPVVGAVPVSSSSPTDPAADRAD